MAATSIVLHENICRRNNTLPHFFLCILLFRDFKNIFKLYSIIRIQQIRSNIERRPVIEEIYRLFKVCSTTNLKIDVDKEFCAEFLEYRV